MHVLVTGAAGRIGSRFAVSTASMLQLRLADRQPMPVAVDADVVDLDVTQPASCAAACAGVDGVLHLAADPSLEADFWSSLLPTNVLGTYNMVQAAVASGVRRFVFASSIQAVEGYPHDQQVREHDPPWPTNDYGVSKAFGEALCASMTSRSRTSFVSARIGNYAEDRPGAGHPLAGRAGWIAPDDAVQLLRLALTAALTGHHVVHGVSDNAFKRLAIDHTRRLLGYTPRQDAFAEEA